MSIPDAHQRLAVLFDAENITLKQLPEIISRIETYGQAIIKRAYADWMLPQFSAWRSKLHKYDIVPIQTLRIVSGKNLADIALTVDAMDILNEGIVDGICIVSSDSDFTPLVRRLQDGGLFAMGIGKVQTPEPFMLACDEFIKIGNSSDGIKKKITKPVSKIKPETQNRKFGILLIQAMTLASSEWVTLSILGTNLRKIDPNFSLKKYGFSSQTKAIEAFPTLFQIKKNGSVKSVRLRVTNLAVRLIQALALADKQWISLSTLGQLLREVDAAFDIKKYNYPSLKAGVTSHKKLIQIKKKDGVDIVKLI